MALSRHDIEIDRGLVWEALLVFAGSQFLSSKFKGQLRPSALSSTVFANFSFDLPLYHTDEDRTEVRVFLPKNLTQTIPETTSALWVYDLKATLSNGSSYVVLAGSARVWQPVTTD